MSLRYCHSSPIHVAEVVKSPRTHKILVKRLVVSVEVGCVVGYPPTTFPLYFVRSSIDALAFLTCCCLTCALSEPVIHVLRRSVVSVMFQQVVSVLSIQQYVRCIYV